MSLAILIKLSRLDYFIRSKAGGSPSELAKKLEISRSQLYNYIDLFKLQGAPIAYDNRRKCFYYTEDGRFHFTFVKSEEDLGKQA
jgi:predicted DNA-binding transcriptional regulator YafY